VYLLSVTVKYYIDYNFYFGNKFSGNFIKQKMTTITEVAIFRKIVEEPVAISLADLNISSVVQTATADQVQDKKEAQKKSYLKLIHQIWSGTTKSIRQNCHV